MNIITENYIGENPNTFIYKLKYQNTFDSDLFVELTNFIANEVLKENDYDTKISTLGFLFNLYSYTTSLIISNFDNNDLFKIVNLIDDYTIYIDRFRNAINFYIDNDITLVLNYKDELGCFRVKNVN